jgi:hypothetical protein
VSEITEQNPRWFNIAWIVLTMVALLVLALYIFNAQNAGDKILFPSLLLGFATFFGAAGVGLVSRNHYGILSLRIASMIAIVGIVTFQF